VVVMLICSTILFSLLLLVLSQDETCCSSAECQSTAYSWTQLNIRPGAVVSKIMATHQKSFYAGCVGGRIWDNWNKPNFALVLRAMTTNQIWDLSTSLNQMNLLFTSTEQTDWELTFTNKNLLWSAYFDLYFDRNEGCKSSMSIDLFGQGMPRCNQSCKSWCWASCLVMAYDFVYGGESQCGKQECQLASGAFRAKCCDPNGQPVCMAPDCDQGMPGKWITEYMQTIQPNYYLKSSPATEIELVSSLQKGYPVIIGIFWHTTGSHTAIIGGVECQSNQANSYLIQDPLYGSKKFTYSQIVNYQPGGGDSGYWRDTILSSK